MDIQQQVKEIKQSFRQMMDGSVAASMRTKGVDYKLNWGATLPRLREKAEEIGKNYDLAIALWKENVRECKILATMIMPPSEVLPEVIDIWMEQTPTQERDCRTGSLQPLSVSDLRSREGLYLDGFSRTTLSTLRISYHHTFVYERTRT